MVPVDPNNSTPPAPTPSGNSYGYVDTSGNTQTINAPDAATALKNATNIDMHSGVFLKSGAPPTPPTAIDSTHLGSSPTPSIPTYTPPAPTGSVPINNATEPLQTLTDAEKQAQTDNASGTSNLVKLYGGLVGEASDTASAVTNNTQINGMKTTLQDLNNQIVTETAKLKESDTQLIADQRAQGERDTLLPFAQSGAAKLAGDAAISRALITSKIGVLNAQVLATQGNITLATKTAEDAVTAKYAPIKEMISVQEAQLKAIAPLLSGADKKLADNQQLAIEKYKTQLSAALELSNYKAKASIDAAAVSAGIATHTPVADATYTVKASDVGGGALTNIAKGLGISLDSLRTLNPQLNARGDVNTGDVLNLPKVDPSISGVYTGNVSVDAWVSSVLNGNATMAQVPKNEKDSVAQALNTPTGGSKYSPLASSRFSIASNRIVANYIAMPNYQLTANGLPYLQRIDAAMKTPGSISDQDLLDSLTKLNTAGNAISDAQVRLITGNKSFSDMASVFGNKFANGGALSDSQRKQLQQIATNIYANYSKGYQPIYGQAVKQLSDAGIPKPFWTIPDLNSLNGGTMDSLNFKAGSGMDLSTLNFSLQ